MFDKIFHTNPPRTVTHNHHTTVVEQRAPTDASLTLLAEMQAAVEKRFIDSIKYEGNNFNCMWGTFKNHETNTWKVCCRFSLNRKEYPIEFEFREPLYFPGRHTANIAKLVKEKLIEKLAEILMLNLVTVPTGQQFSEEQP